MTTMLTSTTYDTVKSVPLNAENLALLVDLDRMHKLVMSNFMDLNGASDSARALLQVTFKTVLPTDQGGKRGMCQVHIRSMEQVDDTSVPSPAVSAGDEVKLNIRLAAGKRNSERGGRTNVRPVSDAEVAVWASELLGSHGFKVLSETDSEGFVLPQVRSSRFRWVGGKDADAVRFPVRDIVAFVRIGDAEKANAAISNGIGRGKNYGLGMVGIEPV